MSVEETSPKHILPLRRVYIPPEPRSVLPNATEVCLREIERARLVPGARAAFHPEVSPVHGSYSKTIHLPRYGFSISAANITPRRFRLRSRFSLNI